ncbi:iron-sulfur cluster assembly scaffold protein [Pleomorphomonas diazotrophica]|uniref:Iron-sulfur cluster assembly scaffold protein n=1 Tax=Pleomorphomonas diazotrophica TaxID=1166257 RepID=A0A1I4QVF3_9HYPH|nr:iron-sulfur cluster assembly scaffold protein [Pleomorphomonas diazotrophica]PKR90397.1 iron-sulfur cluster assembly scaffold protein [Pleomorphomonas diazotrophica]SFM44052.1 NifU homolog involved in Fe-S cluster formation [Pleomorphomonas diazotrophica]
MLDEIYNARILDLAGNIGRIGRLAAPDATATRHSRLCGSQITVDLRMEGDVVADYAHEVKACALGQAAAAVMARHVVGATATELRQARDDMFAMLKEGAAPPAGRFAEISCLEPVRDFKARHTSTMLVFEAVVACLDDIAAARATG